VVYSVGILRKNFKNFRQSNAVSLAVRLTLAKWRVLNYCEAKIENNQLVTSLFLITPSPLNKYSDEDCGTAHGGRSWTGVMFRLGARYFDVSFA
jgi:hypothetical protein